MAVFDVFTLAGAQSRIHNYATGAIALENLEKVEDFISFQSAKRIGSGSLGDVLQATDRTSLRPIAVKVVSRRKMIERGIGEERLRREVQVMSELSHHNIVQLVDVLGCMQGLPCVTSEPPFLCIVSELIDSSWPLSYEIRRSGSQPDLVTKVLPQLASALCHIHSKGIVHRDVWSENVLINQERDIVLVDFGCAESVSGPIVCRNLNIPYLSPQAARCQKQHPSDDSWAVGLLVTEIATGLFVLQRLGRTDIPVHKVPQALSQAISETVALAGPKLGQIAKQLLELEHEQRPSMQEILTRIDAELGTSTGGGSLDGSPLKPAPWTARSPNAVRATLPARLAELNTPASVSKLTSSFSASFLGAPIGTPLSGRPLRTAIGESPSNGTVSPAATDISHAYTDSHRASTPPVPTVSAHRAPTPLKASITNVRRCRASSVARQTSVPREKSFEKDARGGFSPSRNSPGSLCVAGARSTVPTRRGNSYVNPPQASAIPGVARTPSVGYPSAPAAPPPLQLTRVPSGDAFGRWPGGGSWRQPVPSTTPRATTVITQHASAPSSAVIATSIATKTQQASQVAGDYSLSVGLQPHIPLADDTSMPLSARPEQMVPHVLASPLLEGVDKTYLNPDGSSSVAYPHYASQNLSAPSTVSLPLPLTALQGGTTPRPFTSPAKLIDTQIVRQSSSSKFTPYVTPRSNAVLPAWPFTVGEQISRSSPAKGAINAETLDAGNILSDCWVSAMANQAEKPTMRSSDRSGAPARDRSATLSRHGTLAQVAGVQRNDVSRESSLVRRPSSPNATARLSASTRTAGTQSVPVNHALQVGSSPSTNPYAGQRQLRTQISRNPSRSSIMADRTDMQQKIHQAFVQYRGSFSAPSTEQASSCAQPRCDRVMGETYNCPPSADDSKEDLTAAVARSKGYHDTDGKASFVHLPNGANGKPDVEHEIREILVGLQKRMKVMNASGSLEAPLKHAEF